MTISFNQPSKHVFISVYYDTFIYLYELGDVIVHLNRYILDHIYIQCCTKMCAYKQYSYNAPVTMIYIVFKVTI